MKLVIAEDELLCRENLVSIDLETIGVELAGIAKYGAEALELSKRIKSEFLFRILKCLKWQALSLWKRCPIFCPKLK